MNDAESINFKVGVPKDSDKESRRIPARKGYLYNNPSLEDVLRFIEGLQVAKSDRERLAKIASRMPHGALARFRENYMHLLNKGVN
jgi:hypothetical protein